MREHVLGVAINRLGVFCVRADVIDLHARLYGMDTKAAIKSLVETLR
jgi:hypothetical protein